MELLNKMIIGSIELDKFIPSKWELKPFDLKLII